MSFTPEDQHLKPSIDKIIEGIFEFSAAVDARLKQAEDWKSTHLSELIRIRQKIQDTQLELVQLRRNTE
jgi:hypothetical protein